MLLYLKYLIECVYKSHHSAHIRESTTVLDSEFKRGFWIPGTGFSVSSIPDYNSYYDFGFFEPYADSKAQNSAFLKEKISELFTRRKLP